MRLISVSIIRALLPLALATLCACTITSTREAPIIDKAPKSVALPSLPPAADAALPTGNRDPSEAVYVVQRGDTLYSIALASQQDWRNIARWNGIDAAALIKPGQSLRVKPPSDADLTGARVEAPGAVVTVPVAPTASIEARPLVGQSASMPSQANTQVTGNQPTPPRISSTASAQDPQEAKAPTAPKAFAAPGITDREITAPVSPVGVAEVRREAAINWSWPANGKLIDKFDDPRNKGIDIGGREGDPVFASADGEVVYTGSGLRPYGNLIIIKHTDDFISAYAHNRGIEVSKGQAVKRGQRIADMGRTEADSTRLHFEIRRQGKPVDPLKFLAGR